MNTNKLSDLISSLRQIEENPENSNYFKDFENTVCLIGDLKDPNSIPLLIQFLKDDSEELNLMWAIIHTIEIFDTDIYIKEILKTSPYLNKHSPEWSTLIFTRILNSEKDKVELIRQLREASSEIKMSVKNIMEAINKESPEFLAKTIPITVAATV